VEDRLIGAIEIFSRHSLDPGTLDAISSVAQEIALGIERKHAERIVREREAHIRLLWIQLLKPSMESIWKVSARSRTPPAHGYWGTGMQVNSSAVTCAR